MKIQHKIITLSVFLGLVAGAIDALVDHFIFEKGGSSFWESQIYEVPPFEVYIRASAFVIFVIFGTIVAMITDKHKKSEERIKELYESEKELRQDLEYEIKRRVEFNRALVHELKTPIVPIIAAGELLADEVHEEQPLALVRSIQRGASTMSNRIDRLLDVARGELGMLVLEDENVDIVKILNQVVEDMSSVASTRKISLVHEVPSSLPSVWADKGRLEQVIMNIMVNALKYTPSGGKVTLRAKKKDASLLVEIQDTGPGIVKEDWQNVFESYYRVESGKQHPSGLGLGLALCKTIIEAHGGKIWVESEEGKGCTFSFSLPLSKS
ncbi:sensor histidine kinase [Chloroflexota bacterium]